MAAQTKPPSRRIGNAATAVLLVAYFLLAVWGTDVLGGRTAPTSLIWPASGVGLALVLLRGTGIWPLIFAAAFAGSAVSVDADSLFVWLSEVVLSRLTAVIEPLIAACLIWRIADEVFAERVGPFLLAALVAVPVAAFTAAAPLVVAELSADIMTARSELGFMPG